MIMMMMMMMMILTERYEHGIFLGCLPHVRHTKNTHIVDSISHYMDYIRPKNALYLIKYPATIASIVVHPMP